MNILQRHVFGQVAAAVLLAVGLLVFVMLTGTVLKEVFPLVSDGKIGWGVFFQLLGFIAVGLLPFSLPLGLLAGVLTVLGRMSAQNEILAMKSSGLSIWRITSPIFLIAAAGALLSLYINFEFAAHAADTSKRIMHAAIGGALSHDPKGLIVPGEFRTLKKYTIYAETRDRSSLRKVWLWQNGDDGKTTRIVRADTAELEYDAVNAALNITARDATVEEFRNRAGADGAPPTIESHRAQTLRVAIPVERLVNVQGNYLQRRKYRHCTLGELLQLRRTGASPGNDTPPADAAKRHANRIAAQLQIQSNCANSLGIISLTMLAVPLGIRTGRKETLVNFALALALALTFYVLTIVVSWVPPNWRPDLFVWLPNLLFQATGAWLLHRAAKR